MSSRADRIGVCHGAGRYTVGPEDQLTAGANRILELGSRVIKLWFRVPLSHSFPFTDGWPEIRTLTDLARAPLMHATLSKPFSTIVLSCDAIGIPNRWWPAVGGEHLEREAEEFEDLTRHLLDEFGDTDRTFVFQNWEGDWAILGMPPGNMAAVPTSEAIDAMARRLNIRQEAVERGRAGYTGRARVLHAAEVNLVFGGEHPGVSVTDLVLPQTRLDLYSYSAWEGTHYHNGDRFLEALGRIRDKTQPSPLVGRDNVFVGEFGAQEAYLGPAKAAAITERTVREALEFGCPYVLYWTVFDNETTKHPKDGHDYPGFWLLRHDGTKSVQWDVLRAAIVGG